jgi:AsmA protein
MKKILKFGSIILGVLLVVFIAAVIALTVFIDPNEYKDKIAAYVKKETGRELVIKGKISLSYFPWLGLKIGKTSLGNAPGFGDKPFASLGSIDVKVKLLPLLGKRVVMDKVTLNNVYLSLQRNRDGRANWEGLLGREQPAVPATGKGTGGKGGKAGAARFDIGGIRVRNAHVIWDDRRSGQYYEVRKFNFSTGRLGDGRPVDVKLSALLIEGRKGKPQKISLSGDVAWSSAKGELDVKGLKARLRGKQDLRLNTNLHYDAVAGKISMPAFRLRAFGLDVRGWLKGKGIGSKPVISGKVKVAEFVPRKLLQQFKVKVPVTQDMSVLGKASLATGFTWSRNGISLYNMDLRLDDSKVSGKFALLGKKPAYRFTLALDQINLDRYLPPPPKGKAAPARQGAGGKPGGLFPVALLRKLDARGSVRVGKFRASGIDSTDMRATILASRGRVHIYPTSARLYGGQYRGNIRLDVTGSVPFLSLDEHLSNLQAGPFLKAAANWDILSGTANMSAKLTARGNSIAALQRTLSGQVSMDAKDGKIKGVGVVYQILRALALINGEPAPKKGANETVFSSLVFRANVRNGVVSNHTMRLDSPVLRITGSGRVDLPGKRLDYRTRTTLLKMPVNVQMRHLDKLVGQSINVRVHGPFSKLSYQVQLDKLIQKQLQKKAKKKLKKKLDKKLKKKLKKLKLKLKF